MADQPFFIPALLILLVSIPLVFGLIPRNRFYGIRTQKTLSDDTTWYRSNRFGGWLLIFSCIAYLLVSHMFPTNGAKDSDQSLWLIHLAVFLLPLSASMILTVIYSKRL